MNSSKKKEKFHYRRGETTLPEATEIALLHLLAVETKLSPSFKVRCDNNRTLFGDNRKHATPEQKALRLQVRRRREYLLENVSTLRLCLQKRGINIHPQSVAASLNSPPHSKASRAIQSPRDSPSTQSPRLPRPHLPSPASSLFSPIRLSTMSIQEQQQEDPYPIVSAQEIELYVEEWWQNPYGIKITVTPQVESGNTLQTKMEIQMLLSDAGDACEGLFSMAKIHEDGNAIVHYQPVQAETLHNKESVTKLHELSDGGPSKVDTRHLKNAHGYCIEYKNHPKRQWKKVIYRFADGITINNKHFNQGIPAESRDLKTVLRLLPKTISAPRSGQKVKVSLYQPFIFWKVAVTGAERVTKEDEGVTDISDAFGFLGFEGATDIEED